MARTSPSRSEKGVANKQKNKGMPEGSTKLPERLLFGSSKQCLLLFPFALSIRIYTERCFECERRFYLVCFISLTFEKPRVINGTWVDVLFPHLILIPTVKSNILLPLFEPVTIYQVPAQTKVYFQLLTQEKAL